MGLLETINSPIDLKKLSREELPSLAREVRKRIIRTVSERGGHLAPNLGIVELTIAIHYVFDAPDDKIIWDVGHQSYVHKLLTGREKDFSTLRQYGGISGFPRREESEYDSFGTGHSGTSISAALGMAMARDYLGEHNKIIAVIGDGSMTSGVAFEGLNHAGVIKKDMIVILNDNEMSISKNVGAISAYLSRLITGELYTKVKRETEHILHNIPKIGEPVLAIAKKAQESVKGLIGHGIIFEELGFRYVGPINGHRFEHLLTTLENIKKLSDPFLIHVITEKGRGYKPARNDPASFHGTPPFHLSSGKPKKKRRYPSYTQVFSDSLIKIANKDKRIAAITAAMTAGTGLLDFSRRFSDRFYDVGIAEEHAVTFAAGLSVAGMRPVVAIYSTFLQRAYDQIVHDVCLQNIPVTFCIDRAGIVGDDGPTHQGIFDFAYLRHIPSMIVMSPKDENELQHMLYTGLNVERPVAIRYPRGEGIGCRIDKEPEEISIGKGEILVEGNCNIAIVAIGNSVYPSLEAAEILSEEENIIPTVINARFVKPLDGPLLLDITKNCDTIITVEEHTLDGGFGSAVMEFFELQGRNEISNIKIKRIGIPNIFIEHGSQSILRHKYKLDPQGIAEEILKFLREEEILRLNCEVTEV
ncbi:MAG: 1-deoxy-D-xylulose-5-phosphate synthase [Nitrospirota bacterium]